MVGRFSISKFVSKVCRAIQDEFLHEYVRCPTTPDAWKEVEREFRVRWDVPHALGALDGKHIAIKKPKNSGTLYHNFKGFFSIVMLALVNISSNGWTLGQPDHALMLKFLMPPNSRK